VPFELAQVNIGHLVAPIESRVLRDFMNGLDAVNALAEASPGFIWRLQTDEGNATAIQAFQWDGGTSAGVIVNMSVWADPESLIAFTYGDEHRAFLKRRREWFHKMDEAYTALWWVEAGDRPTTDEAELRVKHLRANGPSPFAFTLRETFPAPA
jgi:hypothetical protein